MVIEGQAHIDVIVLLISARMIAVPVGLKLAALRSIEVKSALFDTRT